MEAHVTTNITSNVSSQKNPSIAASLPFELVEQILLHLEAPDVLRAGPYLPRFWRRTIEHSNRIGDNLRQYSYIDGSKSVMSRLYSTTFTCRLAGDTLFIHRDRLGNESIILALQRSEHRLKVLHAWEGHNLFQEGLRMGRWSTQLFDTDDELVCVRKWTSDGKFVRWSYSPA